MTEPAQEIPKVWPWDTHPIARVYLRPIDVLEFSVEIWRDELRICHLRNMPNVSQRAYYGYSNGTILFEAGSVFDLVRGLMVDSLKGRSFSLTLDGPCMSRELICARLNKLHSCLYIYQEIRRLIQQMGSGGRQRLRPMVLSCYQDLYTAVAHSRQQISCLRIGNIMMKLGPMEPEANHPMPNLSDLQEDLVRLKAAVQTETVK